MLGREGEAINENFNAIRLNVNKRSKSLLYQQVLHIFAYKKYVLDENPRKSAFSWGEIRFFFSRERLLNYHISSKLRGNLEGGTN